MKKAIVLILIVLLLSGCNSIKPIKTAKVDDCMIGCFAGMNYDGTKFNTMDANNVTQIEACNRFCELAAKQNMI